ncbi:hypothetical protein EZS27_002418 [termite gut metagenome]|uniref:DUF4493 domain-containing protein n=1 Tax=termite gut metagenome TaxID=433724 RepID=A0A5J4SWM1_9ZZZZ
MKKIFLLVPVFSLVMIIGCSEKSDNVAAYSGDEIRIKANIGAVTRAQIVAPLENNLSVKFARVDGDFEDYSEGETLTGTVAKSDYELTFAGENNKYPAAKGTVNLIGWYPADGAFDVSGKVTHTIDGSTDVMFTNLVRGSSDEQITSITFNHALSYATIKASFEIDAAEEWEDITSVTLEGITGNYDFTLPTLVDALVTTIEPNDTPEIGNVVFDSFDPITTTPNVVGNALFVPCASLKITVASASKSGSVVVAGHFAASTSYVITIKIDKEVLIPIVITNASSPIGEWLDDGGNPFIVDGGTLNPDVD